MSNFKKMKSFLRETKARFKGDTDAAVAERNYRKASSGIEQQIGALKSQLVTAEDRYDDAVERLKTMKYPTSRIEDTEHYIKQIVQQKDVVEQAEERVETIKESIKYFENLQKEFDEEVETSPTTSEG